MAEPNHSTDTSPSTQRPKVLLLGKIEQKTSSDHTVRLPSSSPFSAQDKWQSVALLADLITPHAQDRQSFLDECRSGALDGVVATFRTFESVSITGRFDPELVQTLPESLKFVCHNGAGYDQVDISACTARGIRVSNVPTAVDDATADTNMFLILGALRGFYAGMCALREGHWRGKPRPPRLGHDPEGKTLGILGMGGIGRNLRDKALAFGMTVQYHNRKKLDEHRAGRATYVEFDELLRTSDVISLNLPLNDKTRHIISAAEFDQMKDGVVIVNTARGAVMDEDALVRALNSGKVFSCGLDVYENEPEVHPGLVDNRNVMLVPHMGTWTAETLRAMEICCIDNVRSALETGQLKTPVAEQAEMS
ncbi:MAG: hypothetical protein M1823_000441 [Watsoniomyces obsoletus]|nr:MAG: hypothetical protein M1823_000441 [Watsoniomyces obsoletus]